VSLDVIINDLSSYLEWEREEGNATISVAPDVVAELSGLAAKKTDSKPMSQLPKQATAPQSVVQQKKDITIMKDGDSLEIVASEIEKCTICSLHKVRNNTVPGYGQTQRPDILFVGEAPGADEDEQGIPFVGRSGQLLAKMIEAMGYSRETVFIANINKCRPPDNRKPTPTEMKVCLPFLKRQIALLQPKVIVAMGATAVEGLVGIPKGVGITMVRGKWQKFEGIDLMPTFHPAYMLRNPNMKRPVWDDLKNVLRRLGKPIPAVKK